MKNTQSRTARHRVTPLGFGLAALGRPGYINLGHAHDLNEQYEVASMEQQAHAVLDAAWQAGIRYFDAARSYGRAEAFLGSWLRRRQISADQVAVGSKWGYTYTAEWQVSLAAGQAHEVKEHSLPVLERQIAESERELGSYLSLYQIHSATLESGVMDNQLVLDRLAALREAGVAIGFSVSGVGQSATIERALTVEIDGRPLFDAVQATWNLLEQTAGTALQAAHDAGLLVIVKEALANGRLTARNEEIDFSSKRDRLAQLAAEQGASLDAYALAACLNQPFIDVTLSGAATVEQLHSNARAERIDWTNFPDLTQFKEDSPLYWQNRSRLQWN